MGSHGIWAGIAAGTGTALLIAVLLRSGIAGRVLDRPNERSLHKTSVPRIGGVCLVSVALLYAISFGAFELWALAALALPVMLISFCDDLYGLPAWPRLLTQIFCAVAALYAAGPVPVLLWPVLLLAVVWSMNAYNFMDGSDGLAGGMAVFGFGAYAVATGFADAFPLVIFCAAIAGAAIGFLLFNFYPARLFMGDAGSIPLGFLAAILGIMGWRNGFWAWWFPPLVFSAFLMDASVMVVRRFLRGERLAVAHRDHYYQRLVRSPLGHRGTALAAYSMMAATAGSAIFLLDHSTLAPTAIAFWLAVYGVIFFYVDLRVAALPPPSRIPQMPERS